MDRFHLVIDVCDKIEHELFEFLSPEIKFSAVYLRQEMHTILIKHKKYIAEIGVDMSEITEWKWICKEKPQLSSLKLCMTLLQRPQHKLCEQGSTN
jgi:hypothetical protein